MLHVVKHSLEGVQVGGSQDAREVDGRGPVGLLGPVKGVRELDPVALHRSAVDFGFDDGLDDVALLLAGGHAPSKAQYQVKGVMVADVVVHKGRERETYKKIVYIYIYIYIYMYIYTCIYIYIVYIRS